MQYKKRSCIMNMLCFCLNSNDKSTVIALHMYISMNSDLHAPYSTGLFIVSKVQQVEVTNFDILLEVYSLRRMCVHQRPFKIKYVASITITTHLRLTSLSFSFSSASVSFTLLTNICRISSSLRCRSPKNSFLLAS